MMANPFPGAETTKLQSFLYSVNNTSLQTNSKFIELISLSWSQRNIPLSSIDQAIHESFCIKYMQVIFILFSF